MTFLESILQGIIQGVTEFLPVSSSGHLHIAHAFLGGKEKLSIVFTIILHVFSLLAVLIVLRNEIINIIKDFFKALKNKKLNNGTKLIIFVILATIPTAIIALLFKDIIENYLSNPFIVSFILIFNGIILYLSKFIKEGKKEISYLDAFFIGIIQGFAIIPGISRSGSTITLALLLGVKRKKAGVFSFLISIPAILGAVVLSSKDLITLNTSLIEVYIVGGIFSFIFGYFSLIYLLKLIKSGKLYVFSYYCWFIGVFSLIYLFFS